MSQKRWLYCCWADVKVRVRLTGKIDLVCEVNGVAVVCWKCEVVYHLNFSNGRVPIACDHKCWLPYRNCLRFPFCCIFRDCFCCSYICPQGNRSNMRYCLCHALLYVRSGTSLRLLEEIMSMQARLFCPRTLVSSTSLPSSLLLSRCWIWPRHMANIIQ